MPMQKGHSPEVVRANISELMKSGRSKEQAVAAAMSSARKYKKMAEGGEVLGAHEAEDNSVFDENATTTNQERNVLSQVEPDEISSPEEEREDNSLAMALFKKAKDAQMEGEGYAMGGMVKGNSMRLQDANVSEEEIAESEKHMPRPENSVAENKALSEEQRNAIQAKKARRKYGY